MSASLVMIRGNLSTDLLAGLRDVLAGTRIDIDHIAASDRRWALVQAALEDARAPTTGRAMIELVAFETGVSAARIVGDCRRKAEVRARTAAAWSMVQLLGFSATSAGRRLGDRDHSTILSALRRADRLRQGDPAFRRLCAKLAAAIGARS